MTLRQRVEPYRREGSARERLPQPPADSLFDRFGWLYAFCREHLFRDDTERIARLLWPRGAPLHETVLLELGCGPGFYARRFARRFGALRAVGIDRSEPQLRRARAGAEALGLDNCRFQLADVQTLEWPDASVDTVIATRLLLVLDDPRRTLAEIHRVLRPGGRCVVAEPCSPVRAAVPLLAMWQLARLTALRDRHHTSYIEPRRAAVLSAEAFTSVVRSAPWRQCDVWQEERYRYALCEKAAPP